MGRQAETSITTTSPTPESSHNMANLAVSSISSTSTTTGGGVAAGDADIDNLSHHWDDSFIEILEQQQEATTLDPTTVMTSRKMTKDNKVDDSTKGTPKKHQASSEEDSA